MCLHIYIHTHACSSLCVHTDVTLWLILFHCCFLSSLDSSFLQVHSGFLPQVLEGLTYLLGICKIPSSTDKQLICGVVAHTNYCFELYTCLCFSSVDVHVSVTVLCVGMCLSQWRIAFNWPGRIACHFLFWPFYLSI